LLVFIINFIAVKGICIYYKWHKRHCCWCVTFNIIVVIGKHVAAYFQTVKWKWCYWLLLCLFYSLAVYQVS